MSQTTSTGTWFPDYTIESAPPAARKSMAATRKPLADERLEAIQVFTLQVLEVVLGIGTYTMSTLANRLTGALVDAPLTAFA
jgi:hypothetical protein